MIPTFTSVTPNFGPSGGRFVAVIVGTGFRTSAAIVPAVSVEIDGVASRDVRVYSSTEIQFVVPQLRRGGAGATEDPLPKMDLRIVNLDDDGIPIAGEEVTAPKAFEYRRSALRDPLATKQQQIYQQVIREVIHAFQRQVVANTALYTNVDYGKEGDIKIMTTRLPAAGLNGPRLSEDFINRHHWNGPLEVSFDADEVDFRFSAMLMTFEFDVVLASDKQLELIAMMQALIELFMRTPVILLPETVDAWNEAALHEFPLVLTSGPNMSTQDANSNLFIAEATFEVRHIPFRLSEPIDRAILIDEDGLETQLERIED